MKEVSYHEKNHFTKLSLYIEKYSPLTRKHFFEISEYFQQAFTSEFLGKCFLQYMHSEALSMLKSQKKLREGCWMTNFMQSFVHNYTYPVETFLQDFLVIVIFVYLNFQPHNGVLSVSKGLKNRIHECNHTIVYYNNSLIFRFLQRYFRYCLSCYLIYVTQYVLFLWL